MGHGKLLLYGLMVIILAWGAFVRFGNIQQRPFWRDEAGVACVLREYSYAGLLRQSEIPMPPLFGVLSKALGSMVSPPEIGLRLGPLIAGMACLPLAYSICRLLRCPRTIALAAMSLSASSMLLVLWSRELHQYQLEAFFSMLLAWLVFRFRYRPHASHRHLEIIGMMALCVIGPWFGYGFVFPATALTLLLILLRPKQPSTNRDRYVGMVSLALLGLSTLVIMQTIAQEQRNSTALIQYMGQWFIDPLSIRSWARAALYGITSTVMILFPFDWIGYHPGLDGLVLSAALAAGIWLVTLVGLWRWPGRGRLEMTIWVLMPWLLTLAAAIARYYPFAIPRMTVFLAAPMLLPFAVGLVRIVRGAAIVILNRGAVGMVVGLLLTLLPAFYVIDIPLRQRGYVYHDFPGILDVLQHEHRPGERVISTIDAAPCVRYYIADDPESPAVQFMPAVGATLPMPDCDYPALIRDTVRRAGYRWWVLASSEKGDFCRDLIVAEATRQRYRIQVVTASGGKESGIRGDSNNANDGGEDKDFGSALLLLLTR